MGRPEASPFSRLLMLAFLAVLLACAAWPLLRQARGGAEAPPASTTEWPTVWEGRTLRPLAMSPVEARFAAHFPGRIARLTDGQQVLVWREVLRPTRMLHPAADCYRGLGYRILQAQLERDAQQQLWRCFVAERGGQRTRVCERIIDARGQAYTDTSSWFWAAQTGQSTGPWQAITVANTL